MTSFLEDLDDQVLCYLFHYLCVSDCGKCMSLSTRFRNLLCAAQSNLLWKQQYVGMFGLTNTDHIINTNWRLRTVYIYKCIKCAEKSSTEPQSPVNARSLDWGVQGPMSRAGHTAHRIITNTNEELIFLIGGASDHFRFHSSYDILQISEKTCRTICSPIRWNSNNNDLFESRWQHAGITIDQTAIVYGGQMSSYSSDPRVHFLQHLDDHTVHTGVFRMRPATTCPFSFPHPVRQVYSLPGYSGSKMVADPLVYAETPGDFYHRVFLFVGKDTHDICHNTIFLLHLYLADHSMECFEVLFDPARIPSPRYCPAVALAQRHIYLHGGWYVSAIPQEDEEEVREVSVFYHDMYSMHLDNWTWTKLDMFGTLPAGRCQHELLPVNPPWVEETQETQETQEKQFLLLFGGAARRDVLSQDNNDQQAAVYGNVVVDLPDFHLFDLQTGVWIDLQQEYSAGRGGCSAVAETSGGWMLFGGMHSDANARMPTFRNNVFSVALTDL